MFNSKYGDVHYKYSFEQEVMFTLREWGTKLKLIYIVRIGDYVLLTLTNFCSIYALPPIEWRSDHI